MSKISVTTYLVKVSSMMLTNLKKRLRCEVLIDVLSCSDL